MNRPLLHVMLSILLILGVAACGRRPPPPAPPADTTPPTVPPPGEPGAAAPSLDLRVEPQVIRRGESALLSWDSENSQQVFIDHNIGSVGTSGRIKFFPEETTTYQVSATGPGGRVDKSVTIEVLTDGGDAGVLEEDLRDQPIAERFNYFVKPVFFNFDSAGLSEEAKLTLGGNIRWLQQPENANLRFVLEGHCDQRGTDEYNLSLGDKRTRVVREYLIDNGIDPSRISTVSLGEEQPFEQADTEEAHALNRRVQFVLVQE
ncbi:MAG: OmpA family protein [Acidobacteriota bacterium]